VDLEFYEDLNKIVGIVFPYPTYFDKFYLFYVYLKFVNCYVPLQYKAYGTEKNTESTSVADPDPGSGIGCLFGPWIRDPGWEKVSIRIRDPG
jgi:hypothetical protein